MWSSPSRHRPGGKMVARRRQEGAPPRARRGRWHGAPAPRRRVATGTARPTRQDGVQPPARRAQPPRRRVLQFSAAPRCAATGASASTRASLRRAKCRPGDPHVRTALARAHRTAARLRSCPRSPSQRRVRPCPRSPSQRRRRPCLRSPSQRRRRSCLRRPSERRDQAGLRLRLSIRLVRGSSFSMTTGSAAS